MKKVLKKSLSLLLALTIILSSAYAGLSEVDFGGFGVEAKAATFEQINATNVFVKQGKGSNTCTLCAAVSMMRRVSMMRGDVNWSAITEAAVKPTAWAPGLYYSFDYSNSAKGIANISVRHSTLPGSSSNTSTLINLLAKHPEGIVIFNGVHAVLLTDYTNGVFYCSDPAYEQPSGRITASRGYSVKPENATDYWYVSSPSVSINNNTKPLATPTITFDKSSYTEGDTITVSWIVSPSNSNLSHYWINVRNPAGNLIINEKIDKSKTSYSFATPGVGTYEVTISATPYGSVSGEGSLTNTKSITINARTYTVSYNANGGTGAPAAQTKTPGVTLTLSKTMPTRAGYTFWGWSFIPDGVPPAYGPGSPFAVDANTTLYAIWKPNYTIVYNGNGNTGGSTASSSHNYCSYLTSSTDEYYREYEFMQTGHDLSYLIDAYGTGRYLIEFDLYSNVDGWVQVYLQNGSGSKYSFVEQFATTTSWKHYSFIVNVDLQDASVSQSLLAFYSGYGTGCYSHVKNIVFTKVDENLSANGFTRDGYSFLGWSTDPNATSPTYTDKQEIKNLTSGAGSVVTLYAVWMPNLYNIVYNGNGNTGGLTADSSHQYYNSLTSTGEYYREYEFMQTGHDLSPIIDSYGPGKYLIEFDLYSDVDGWVQVYLQNDSGSKYSFVEQFATTTSWKHYSFIVNVDLQDASVSQSLLAFYSGYGTGCYSHVKNIVFTKVDENLSANGFTRDGYSFLGWSTDPNATTPTYTDKQAVKNLTSVNGETITLYAVWKDNHVHDYKCTIEQPATCTQEGLRVYTCECEDTYTEEIPATGHLNTMWITEQEPACAEDGYKDEWCLDCGEIINTETIPAYGHSGEEWFIDIAPTCTEPGSRHRICSVCGENVTEEILATGHSCSSEWIIDVEPTCTEEGSKSHHCTVCGDKTDITVVEALGHTYSIEWAIDVAPTCTEEGSKSHHCDVCGDKTDITVIEPLGHIYSTEWTIDTAPTCTEDGSKSHHCIGCDELVADVTVIPSLGHDYELVSIDAEHPHTNKYKCSRCPDTKEEESYSDKCGVCNFSFTNVDAETCRITAYTGGADSFIIPATINGRTVATTTTGAFKNNATLTSVKIEEGVQGLGSLAFLGCKALSKVVIPESVTSIGTNAFYNCASDLTIYCYHDSYAMEYAVDNSLNYVVMDVGETDNCTIDYDKELIFAALNGLTNLDDILYVPASSMAFAEASHISGNNEYLGTGSIVFVFDGEDISSEYTLVVSGDTNGDSICDALDCFDVERAANSNTELSDVYAMAADSNSDDVVDTADYQAIVNKALAS